MIRRILLSTKFLFYMAIICTLLLTLLLFVYGLLVTANVLLSYLRPAQLVASDSFKDVMVAAIEVIDVFLLATVTYIMAMGFYSLSLDSDMPLPRWLKISSLYDLKLKLISVMVVVVSVYFVGVLIDWKGEGWGPLILGGGVGLFVTAITFYVWKGTGD